MRCDCDSCHRVSNKPDITRVIDTCHTQSEQLSANSVHSALVPDQHIMFTQMNSSSLFKQTATLEVMYKLVRTSAYQH